MSNMNETNEAIFSTGAKRNKLELRYDLIPIGGLKRVARVCFEGAKKYGEDNWLKGIPVGNLINHAINHIYLYLEGDETEDHLAHAAWNLLAALHFDETNRSDLFNDLIFRKFKPKNF